MTSSLQEVSSDAMNGSWSEFPDKRGIQAQAELSGTVQRGTSVECWGRL